MTEKPIIKAIEEIKVFNKKHNLIARGSLDQQVEESVKEALQLAKILQDKKTILDLGAGSGLVGITLATKIPTANILLAETNKKKAYHLKRMIRATQLPNIEVCPQLSKNKKIMAQAVTTKAFKTIKDTLDLLDDMVHKPFAVYFLKGRAEVFQKELAEASILPKNHEIIKMDLTKERFIIKITNE